MIPNENIVFPVFSENLEKKIVEELSPIETDEEFPDYHPRNLSVVPVDLEEILKSLK